MEEKKSFSCLPDKHRRSKINKLSPSCQDGAEWTGKHGKKRLIPHLKYGFLELQYMHTITSNYYVVSMF